MEAGQKKEKIGDQKKKEIKVPKPLSRRPAWEQKNKLTMDLRRQKLEKGQLRLQVGLQNLVMGKQDSSLLIVSIFSEK